MTRGSYQDNTVRRDANKIAQEGSGQWLIDQCLTITRKRALGVV
jgi:hypothetical protein